MTPVLLKICFCDSIALFANNPANTASVARRSEPCRRFDAALLPANYQRAYIQCQFRGLISAAVSQADTLCYHLLLPMMQGVWVRPLVCKAAPQTAVGATALCLPQTNKVKDQVRAHLQKFYRQKEETSRSLTLAPRCPVRRFVPAARVNSPPMERAGKNRRTFCRDERDGELT